MFACTTEKYERLYAPWLGRPGDLLEWGKARPEESLLDFCGGTGAIALTALDRGMKEVWLLDLNPRCRDPRVHEVRGRAEEACSLLNRSFSLIVCRQALGYLDLTKTAETIYELLEPRGRFVFNNFLQPRWAWKWYRHEGQRFLEISAHTGRQVLHLQAAPGIGADFSVFRWHKHEEVLAAFQDRFHVFFDMQGRTVRYLCRKRERKSR